MKDRTFYMNLDGGIVRVRASKKPDKETTKAIGALVKAVKMRRKKENRGGARKGAGRPKTKEDTIVIRVPKSLVPKIKEMISKHQKK